MAVDDDPESSSEVLPPNSDRPFLTLLAAADLADSTSRLPEAIAAAAAIAGHQRLLLDALTADAAAVRDLDPGGRLAAALRASVTVHEDFARYWGRPPHLELDTAGRLVLSDDLNRLLRHQRAIRATGVYGPLNTGSEL
ncbi:hypothetical protein [Amycolatopsis sp. NPDC004378]